MAEVTEGHRRYRHWNIRDFTAGYMDGLEENLMPENAAKDCSNVISRYIGSLESRKGQEVLNSTDLTGFIQGLYPYHFKDEGVLKKYLIAVHNGEIGYWDFDADSFVQIESGYDNEAPMLFETTVNYLVGMNGIEAPWKWDGTTFSALDNAPPQGKLPVLHKEKLFCVDASEPSTLKWSDTFEPEDWPGVFYWDVNRGDGDEIVCLKKFIGELIIFKRRSTHTLKGISIEDMQLQELDTRIGAVGPRAVAQHKNHLYIVSDKGIHQFNGVKFDNISNFIIPRLWGRVNKDHLSQAAVGVWDELIWFALPVDGSITNNMVLIYDLSQGEQGAWWPWDGMDISCFATWIENETLVLYTGHPSEGKIVQQYVGKTDVGFEAEPQSVNAYWESKYFDFDAAGTEKKTKRAFVELLPGEDTDNPLLKTSQDYQDYEDMVLERKDDMIKQYRFINRERWRYLSVRFEEVEEGGFIIRGILVPFKPKAKPKVRGGFLELEGGS